MVVCPQRSWLFSYRWFPWDHVLLYPQAGGATNLLLSIVDRALLDAHLSLHLGGTAPPPLHSVAGLGADARHDILGDAVDAVMGRHGQWIDDTVRCLGQVAYRSCREVACGVGGLLWHVDI